MTIPTWTVREIPLERQTSIREFEQSRIDHTNVGAPIRLAEARGTTNFEVDEFLAALEAAPNVSDWGLKIWTGESLARISSHIVTNHHALVKRALPKLTLLAREVADLCGSAETELPVIALALEKLNENPGRNDRHYTVARQLLHESLSRSWLY